MAARIPRLGGSGDSGGFASFGGGSDSGANGRPGLRSGNGSAGSSGELDVPGGPLPVRTPGGKGSQQHPTGTGGTGGSVFGGGNGFGASDIGPSDFSNRMPGVGGDGGASSSGPAPTLVPSIGSGNGHTHGNGNGNGNGSGFTDAGQVTVPPSASATTDQRLPIFDSLESDWFRRSGKPLSAAAAVAEETWNSPADEGWKAARVAASPAAGETTLAGLPKRVPRANLVPGSVGNGGEPAGDSEPDSSALPVRSAEMIRSRMASFQRGVREARAAAPQDEEP